MAGERPAHYEGRCAGRRRQEAKGPMMAKPSHKSSRCSEHFTDYTEFYIRYKTQAALSPVTTKPSRPSPA